MESIERGSAVSSFFYCTKRQAFVVWIQWKRVNTTWTPPSATRPCSRELVNKPILPDGIWNLEHEVKSDDGSQLLPDPEWGEEVAEALEFSSPETFRFFLKELCRILESELETHPYNTFGSFLAFYDAFKKQKGLTLEEFFRRYEATIMPDSLSCVGLGCSLASRMRANLGPCYPGLARALFLASCEEMIMDVEAYVSQSPPSQSLSVKEHVLVVLRVDVEGRMGYVVLDPGYHVGIPVVVMEDGQFPDTGWFLSAETAKAKKEYCYAADGTYIKWHVKETRSGKVNTWTNLVFVGRKFLSCVGVSEKRNLVFNFRTIVARNRDGPFAGIYCNFEGDERFTFFYNEVDQKRVEVKIPFDYFKGESTNNSFEGSIASCCAQIGFNEKMVKDMIVRLIEAFYDSDFLPFVRILNLEIDEE
ncbi:hypothetical protein JTE90_017377 [Oedothorax gibbosus]|uniref:Uncharacterized protein n=1 Tax=Oedothorax gibbosus TaxID=931172 RepID=A0AAV6VRJ9_9ARAC|nr:hypothetical protein JTE90_017377 [Oedothorax gibbosus]